MTKAEKAKRLRQISQNQGITFYDAAVRNPNLAGGLEVLAQQEAGQGPPRGSGPSVPKPLVSSGLKPHRTLD